MSAQDAMQAAGLSAGAQMTGQQLAAQRQLRGAGVQSDIGLGQRVRIRSYGYHCTHCIVRGRAMIGRMVQVHQSRGVNVCHM